MKAVPFIEQVKEGNPFFPENIIVHHKLIDFYSQEFKPELIPELFEGWCLHTALNSYYNSKRDFYDPPLQHLS